MDLASVDIPTVLRDIEATAKERGISIPQLCKDADINRATWQRWKAGAHTPHFGKLQKLLAALERSAEVV